MFSDQFRRGESEKGLLKGAKSSKLVSDLSDIAWKAFQSVNTRLPEGEAIRPEWAPGPLLKSYERTSPPLGFPRETDSLCPRCVKEVRDAVISVVSPSDSTVFGSAPALRSASSIAAFPFVAASHIGVTL